MASPRVRHYFDVLREVPRLLTEEKAVRDLPIGNTSGDDAVGRYRAVNSVREVTCQGEQGARGEKCAILVNFVLYSNSDHTVGSVQSPTA